MATANIRAVITAEDRASSTIKGFGNELSTLGNKLKTTVKAGAIAAAAAIGVSLVANIDNAVKRLDTLNNSARAFENMGFATKEVDKAMKALEKSILGLPTPLDSAVRGMTAITASINDVDKGQKIFTALNNAILGFGGTTEMVDNAVLQLSQDMGTGRVTAQTWLSLMNSGLTPALAAMSRQMGITTKELKEGLSAGTISIDEFIENLVRMNKEGGGGMKSFEKIAKDSTRGIQSSWQNMNTAIARGIANLLNSIGRDKIAGAIQAFGVAMETAFKGLIAFSSSVANLVKQLITHLRPSLLAIMNTFKKDLLPALKELWEAINPGFTQALKILAILLGVTLVVAIRAFAAVLNVVAGVLAKVISAVSRVIKWFGNLGSAAVNAGRTVIGAFSGIANKITSPFKSAFDWIIRQVNRVRDALSNLSPTKAIGGVVNKIKGLIPGFQTGTSFAPGGLSVVGERGAELVSLPRGAKVHPNDKTQKMMGGGGTVNVNVNIGLYSGSEREKRKVAQELFKSLKDVASSQNLTMQQMLGQ